MSCRLLQLLPDASYLRNHGAASALAGELPWPPPTAEHKQIQGGETCFDCRLNNKAPLVIHEGTYRSYVFFSSFWRLTLESFFTKPLLNLPES